MYFTFIINLISEKKLLSISKYLRLIEVVLQCSSRLSRFLHSDMYLNYVIF